MAKYTTEIRSVVEAQYPLFDFEYPIFDEAYRGVLEKKIVDFYYFREVGFETIAQFKHFLKSRLNVIMPYYNQLYLSENLITKDDYNINLNTIENHTRTSTVTNDLEENSTVNNGGTVSDSTNGTSSENTTNSEKFSDTPQGGLVVGADYLSNMKAGDEDKTSTIDSDNVQTIDTNSTGSTTNTGTVSTIEDYEVRLTGGGGVRYNADVLMEWRKSFLNIDKQIIDELADLFMGIW